MIVLKLDGIRLTGISSIQETKKTEPTKNKESFRNKDGVVVSDFAHIFQNIVNKTKEIPSVDQTKIKHLQQQIENGQFVINNNLIAQKIISGKE